MWSALFPKTTFTPSPCKTKVIAWYRLLSKLHLRKNKLQALSLELFQVLRSRLCTHHPSTVAVKVMYLYSNWAQNQRVVVVQHVLRQDAEEYQEFVCTVFVVFERTCRFAFPLCWTMVKKINSLPSCGWNDLYENVENTGVVMECGNVHSDSFASSILTATFSTKHSLAIRVLTVFQPQE